MPIGLGAPHSGQQIVVFLDIVVDFTLLLLLIDCFFENSVLFDEIFLIAFRIFKFVFVQAAINGTNPKKNAARAHLFAVFSS